MPAGEGAPATQAAASATPPAGEALDAPGAATAALAGRAASPGTPPARGTDPRRAPRALPEGARAAGEGREGTKYRAHTKPSHTHTSPPKPYPPKDAFSEGRPRLVHLPVPKCTPADIMLPQLQWQPDARCVVKEGHDGEREAHGAGGGNVGRGAEGSRVSARGQTQGTGESARSNERGQGHGPGTTGSSSGGGHAHGARQGAGSG